MILNTCPPVQYLLGRVTSLQVWKTSALADWNLKGEASDSPSQIVDSFSHISAAR